MSNVAVKICGLTRPEDISAISATQARYAGFVFFPKSPRNVTFDQARSLAIELPVGIAKVALIVNADDAVLAELLERVPIDILQLHGSETPERVVQIRHSFGLPVMKAVGISDPEDVRKLSMYEEVADQILVDAKPPRNGDLPGGNGLSFDWRLISGRAWSVPWMLAGGLDAGNVAQAIQVTGAHQVDVSSGVEETPGVKSPTLMQCFVDAALTA